MSTENPYAAPRSDSPAAGESGEDRYTPLSGRALLASVAVVSETFFATVVHVAQIARADHADVGSTTRVNLVTELASLALFAALVASVVLVCVWVHRAARNLRALGRLGMKFTPASSVGAFFIPIASLWLPFQALREIWCASDPEAPQGSWLTSPSTSLLGVWWAAWLSSQVLAWGVILAQDDPVAAGAVGLAADVFKAAASVALILLMRGVASRQATAAANPR